MRRVEGNDKALLEYGWKSNRALRGSQRENEDAENEQLRAYSPVPITVVTDSDTPQASGKKSALKSGVGSSEISLGERHVTFCEIKPEIEWYESEGEGTEGNELENADQAVGYTQPAASPATTALPASRWGAGTSKAFSGEACFSERVQQNDNHDKDTLISQALQNFTKLYGIELSQEDSGVIKGRIMEICKRSGAVPDTNKMNDMCFDFIMFK